MEWFKSNVNSDMSFSKRLVMSLIVEAIFFCSSFAVIYWFKEKNILPGFTQSNELISRDEMMHCEFSYLIYSKLKNKLSIEDINRLVISGVNYEKRYIDNMFASDIIGLNPKLLKEYVEYCADNMLLNLGYGKIYNTKCQFEFMKKINVQIKTNFFETRTTAYKIGSIEEKTIISDDF